jgi:hypothetical protein
MTLFSTSEQPEREAEQEAHFLQDSLFGTPAVAGAHAAHGSQSAFVTKRRSKRTQRNSNIPRRAGSILSSSCHQTPAADRTQV